MPITEKLRPRLRLTAIRWLCALTLLSAVSLLCWFNTEIRQLEAQLLASWLSPILPQGVQASGHYYLVTIANGQIVGFNITLECTVLLMLVPLSLLSALLLIFTQAKVTKVFLGLGLALLIDMFINQFRLGLVALMTQIWGMDLGYQLSHRFIGSIIALLGFVLGFFIILQVTLRAQQSPLPSDTARPPGSRHR